MKTLKTLILATGLILGSALTSIAQSVGINTDGSTPDASALLDVKSTTQGVLVPRMTTTARNAIASPANGLMVFDTDLNAFYFNAGTPTVKNWTAVGGGLSGTVPIANGGTGQTTAAAAANALLPSQSGNSGKTLTTDGTNLSWGSSSGANLVLKATVTASQTLAVGSSVVDANAPTNTTATLIEFNQPMGQPLATFGTWNGNTFTVGAGGAGLYLISVQITSSNTFVAPMIDINNGQESGTSFFGFGTFATTIFQNPHKGRGQLQAVVYLNGNDTVTIRGTSGNASSGAVITTNGSSNVTFVKLN